MSTPQLPLPEGAIRAAQAILPMCGIPAVTKWAAEIIAKEMTCQSCARRERLGITLLDKPWLDPVCHQGCQSLVMSSRGQKLADALRALIISNEQHDAAVESVMGRPVNWRNAYLAPARAALAEWEKGEL